MNVVFKVSDNVKEKMIDYYKDMKKDKNPPYTVFQANEADTVITMYESGKVMFQGLSADVDANMWMDMERHLNNRDVSKELKDKKDKKKDVETKDLSYYRFPAIGSDEVGTGDYLLPIVVTAAFVKREDHLFLEDLKLQDSKKMTDEKILEIVPKIIERIEYESMILSNKEYNEYKAKDINMNKVKAIMHNKVLVKLSERVSGYEKIIVDQFTTPRSYFGYLKSVTEKVTKITFLTKAEDKNLSVACASVISRYIFLQEAKKLEKKYNIRIPKGAGALVDEASRKFVSLYGKDILNEISKVSFKNTEKILND